MSGRVPDHAEKQASRSAERVAVGRAVRVQGAAARVPSSPFGVALPGSLRRTMEGALGVDLATIRIRDDGVAAAAARSAGALAVTVGEDVAFAPGRYRPDTPDGRVLIAHEVTHVVQQRTSGVHPQFQDAGTPAAAPAEEPVWFSVSLSGVTVSSPGRLMVSGESSQRAYLRVALRRIAPDATPEQLDTVLDRLAVAPVQGYGRIEPGRVIPPDERFEPFTIDPFAFAQIAAILDDLHVAIAMTPEQRRILRIGLAATAWQDEGVATLQREFPWYSVEIWHAQLNMHTQLLADALAEQDAAAPGTRAPGGLDALLAQLRHPLAVLDATRTDERLAQVPTGPVTGQNSGARITAFVWQRLWGIGDAAHATTVAGTRVRAIQFYWTAPARYGTAVHDHTARADFLLRMGHWLGRAVPVVDAEHDYTQQLLRDPGRFTDRPFPAHLEAVPQPTGDLRIVPAHADHRYRFSVDFTDVFDAFGSYAYRWDVLEWRPAGAGTARDVREVEGGHTDAATRRSTRGGPRTTDVLGARLARDLAHARADAERLVATFGPPSVEMTSAAVGLLGLRTLSTVARTLVDVVTLENGAGVRERMIQLPGPGLWVVRAAAVPLFEEADEIHRAPSIAYIPVYALPQEELADRALDEAIEASRRADRERADAQLALADLITAPGADPALVRMAAELSADPMLGSDRWAALESTQRSLRTRRTELQNALAGTPPPAPTPEQATLLRAQLDAVERQIDQNDVMLTTHQGRVRHHPGLGSPTPMIVSFVSDVGQTLQLSMEWAEQTREQASFTVTVGAAAEAQFVVLSDHTTANGGLQEAAGADLDEAVQTALTHLLEGRTGYGRGVAAVQLPSGATLRFRIEASLGSLLNESLDAATTLVTVGALAAAPFTGGASLTILIPVGIVAGVRAAERMYARYDASTLRWDMQTLQDFVDIASAAVGVGSIARGARAGMQISMIGRIAAVSFDIGSNVTGFVIIGVGLAAQLREIDATPGLSVGERRSRRMVAIGGALVAAGMQGATILITHAYGPRGEPGGPPTAEAPPDSGTPPVRAGEPHVPAPVVEPHVPAPVVEPHVPAPVAEPHVPAPVVEPHVPAPVAEPHAPAPSVEPAPVASDAVPHPPTPAAAPPRPTRIDDLLTTEGHIRPEYPDLAAAWDAYATRTRTGGRDPLSPREWALSQTRGGPARALSALLPPGWRRGARAVYPGARPRAVALDVPSPRPGTPVEGTSLRWTRRVVRTEELRPLMDGAGEIYWSFPELRPGEVLVLPNGSRIWIDPHTGAVVDSNPVGPSISAERGVTRGEEAMFVAEDRSQAHVDAGTQRLHGATSPGLGGDAPYSIAGGPRALNLVVENSGIEAWVRALRSNAPPGVDYLFTTRTLRSPRGDLLSRSYSVAALEGGRATPIADFEVRMRGGGITDADVEVPGWHVHTDGIERYGAPELRNQPANPPPGGRVSVGMPEALGRVIRGGGTAADPRVSSPLTDPLEAAQAARGRLGALSERVLMSPTETGGLAERLVELDDALAGAESRIAHGSVVDPAAVSDLSAVVARINEIVRVRTRFEGVDLAELSMLARMLDGIATGG